MLSFGEEWHRNAKNHAGAWFTFLEVFSILVRGEYITTSQFQNFAIQTQLELRKMEIFWKMSNNSASKSASEI